MKKNFNTVFRLLLFVSIGVGLFYYIYQEQAAQYLNFCISQGNLEGNCSLVDKVRSDLRNAYLPYLILTLVFYFISNISRAIRWRLLVEAEGGEIRLLNTFLATMVGYCANLAIPRFGEFVRAGLLARYERIDPARVMGTVVTDRLLDLLCLLLIFGLGMILASGQIVDYLQTNAQFPEVSYFGIFGLILVLLLLSVLVVFLVIRCKDHRLIVSIRTKIKSFILGIMSIREVKNYRLLVFHSINIWLMYFLMTFFPLLSFEATSHLGPIAGLLVFIFGGLGMVLPAPGGIGTFHAMVIAGLSIYGISGPDAFSVAMIIFLAINICVNLLMGIVSIIILPMVNKHYHPNRTHVRGYTSQQTH